MNRKMKSVVMGFLVIALILVCIPFINVNAAGLVGIDENSKNQTVAQGTKVSIDISGYGSDVKYWLEIHRDSEDGEIVFSEFRWVDNLKQKYKDFHETFYWDTSNVKMSKYYVVVKVPYSSSVYSETKNIVIDQTDIYVVAPSHVEAPKIDGYTAMYRLFNNNTGEHFYTGSFNEEKTLVVRDGWCYEGVAWYAPNLGKPVYRLYNPYSGEHHYTTNEDENNYLSNNGWNYEGIGWYTDESGIPVYRLFNPNAKGIGAHHYSADENEKNILISQGWKYEGVGWYGYAGESEKDSQDTPSEPNNKYEQLKDYVISNGVVQDNNYYWLIKYDDNNIFGICYKPTEDSFEFYVKNTSSITDSTLVMTTNGTITGTGQVMCASLGPVATGQVDIATYSKSTEIEVKPSDNQGMTNSLLRIGFLGWEYMMTQYIGIQMKDLGFISYSI